MTSSIEESITRPYVSDRTIAQRTPVAAPHPPKEVHDRILLRTNRIVERSKQLEALYQIASSVSQSLDFQDTLSNAVVQVSQLMEFEGGLIYLTDTVSGQLSLKAHYGFSPHPVDHLEQLDPTEEFIDSVIREGEPLVGQVSAESDGALGSYLQGKGFWFVVSIPLRARGGTLGAMILASHGPRLVNQDSGYFLISIGDIIGVAIENASLFRNAAELLEETKLQAERLERSERQFRAIAELGQRALAGAHPHSLMDHAVALVARTLEAEFAKVLELLPEGKSMLLRAGFGWKEGFVGHATIPTDLQSQASYALKTNEPVIVDDLATESRFSGPSLLHEHGVVSGMSVLIPGRSQPFGILGIHTKKHRVFTKDDVHFLQGVANVIAEAVARKQAEEAIYKARERLGYLLSSSPAVIYSCQPFGHYAPTFVSENVVSLVGHESREFINDPKFWADRIHPDDAPRVFDEVRKLFEHGTHASDYRFRHGDGNFVWIHDELRLIRDAHGRPKEIIGSWIDITERREAEEELAAEKERLAVTLRSIGDAVITTDTENRIVLINQVAELMTGYKHAEAVGRSLCDVLYLIDKKTGERCVDIFGRISGTDEKRADEKVNPLHPGLLVARDGTERVIAESGASIRDQDGKIIGQVLVFRDITDKQKMEEEMLRTQKLESLGLLAGGIAHDFNNILTTILGNISMAKAFQGPIDEIREILNEAEKASTRARDLTHQLLTFSKGGAPIKKTTSIADIVKDSAGFALRGSNVKCEFVMPDELWPIVADEGQISQVIQNMIINAVQAMPGGGIVKVQLQNISVGSDQGAHQQPGDYVQISIEDQGVGIPQEHLGKIFDPYFTTKPGGVGLGLATTYSIIKKHNGHIEVISQAGVGTTFTVALPASKKEPEVKKKENRVPCGGHGNVLVMDDEPMIRDLTRQVLKRAGYNVEAVDDGARAIEVYMSRRETDNPFDVVIMDLTIPGGMGGKEALANLLKVDPDIKAIVSSGYSHDPVMANYREHGFTGCVAKPYKIEELTHTLHSVLCG